MDAHESSESSVRDRVDSLTDWVVASSDGYSATERYLWGIVALAFVADVHLTYLGLQHGLTEGNPVARWAIGVAGIGALVLIKMAVLGIAGLVRRQYPRHGPVIPLGLGVPWVMAVALNAITLS